ncbi:MAG: transcription-repair coupling factor [Pleurocapsa minor GSE-CHR-MK-17-07R]|jgi:transcription-repair coupling factor (superfamily II helicase)|nr:transcription-repair coupling factor [Pleurocapsa minor GSE-CHR-MK 17-07R]
MILTGLTTLLRESEAYRRALSILKDDARPTPTLGVLRAARAFTLAALAQDWPGPVVYVTARVDRAYNASEQLPVWLPERRILRFSEPAPLFYERSGWGENVTRGRIETLAALLQESDRAADTGSQQPLIITSARAMMQRTMPVNQFRKASQVLKVGARHPLDRLIDGWMKAGYEAVNMVTEAGTFARRGGLLDIFPPAMQSAVRIEFFDDEIDSLRLFDPATQRTIGKVGEVLITPAREALPEATPAVARHLGDWFSSLPSDDMTSPRPDHDALASGAAFPFLEYYLPYLNPYPVTMLDYAPDDALIVLEDQGELRDTMRAIEEAAVKARDEKLAQNLIPPDFPVPYINWDEFERALAGRHQVIMGGLDDIDSPDDDPLLRGILAPENRFGGQIKSLLTELRSLKASGDRCIVVTAQAARMIDIWRETENTAASEDSELLEAPPPRTITFVDGTLQEGFRLRSGRGDTHVFSDSEVFGWSRPEPRRRKTARKAGAPETHYADLKEGDYVVHSDYGVGRFVGLRRRTLEGVEREYLMLEYAGTDALFVPIHQADRLTRFVGADDKPPTLNKLGQPDWIRIKGKAQKAAEEEARELLDLYAARASVLRPAYSPDGPWQHELEASFPYVETEDQLKAAADIKEDLSRPHPMDRLVCGDVGFGKTEVALRAAFKAVNDGKQVAVLVPTTILAQQHYETFSRRLAAFPVKVEMLSRFRTPEAQRRIIALAAQGEIDILVGTHRILSEDVQFKDLGMVVIDEEQRFGVKHKEYFKRFRNQVDVLTLTATPIPRTLYMSLGGIRDISMIQTPPEERLPVITHVGTYDDRLVRQAVLREMERGGQVYYVHNRVQSIEQVRERLEIIVPEARTVVGHGQMDERLLESVMEQFGNGEFDILIATSIIESGLDIPNANTLIIDRSDWFGLAQLYQLRGRVGRGAQQAYAYFFHPAHNKMNSDVRQRLETLSEYTNLGAGFQIAMRDLELRGAGDVLSTRQSGHIAAVGLHLYTQMLAQAVRTLRREKAQGESALPPLPPISQSTVQLDLPIAAYLPADWIPEIEMRLSIYRRIGSLSSLEEVAGMRAELQDRFGSLPIAVEGMLYQIEIKLLAQAASASAILRRDERFEIRLPYLVEVNRERLEATLGSDVRVTRVAVELRTRPELWRERLAEILHYLARHVRSAVGGT